MAHRNDLSDEERVREILRKTSGSFDTRAARERIELNTRCRRCGKAMSSLERITFQDICAPCMRQETKELRERFAKKYLLTACAFVLALVLGGYCANSQNETLRIIGVVISALMLGPALGYVFYTNMDKIFPGGGEKAQTWTALGLAAGIDLIITVLTYVSRNWILYVALMLLAAAYIFYIAYGEFGRLRQRLNLISLFDRKSSDEEYVESITDALERRSDEDEREREEYEAVHAMDSVPDETAALDEAAASGEEASGGENGGETENAAPPESGDEDSGAFSI